MQVEITKRNGIDGPLSEYSPSKVEEQKQVITVGDDFYQRYERLINDYQCVRRWVNYTAKQAYTKFVNNFGGFPDDFTPADISSFIHVISNLPRQDPSWTGLYISRLLQYSYNAGHNDFRLDTTSLPGVKGIAAFIDGRRKKPITVSITGDAGWSGWYSRWAHITVHGNSYGCGTSSDESEIIIHGEAGEDCAQLAKFSTFTFLGTVGDEVGMQSRHCTFKTSNEETLQKLVDNVPRSNRIIFIEKYREILIKDYDHYTLGGK